jgi:hypothetical protein
MKIEIEHQGSCLGATGGTGRLIDRDSARALAKGHSVVVLLGSRPGKIPANAIVLGASHPQLREEPPSNCGCLRAALDVSGLSRCEFPAGFLGISSDFADAVDVLGRLRTLLDGGPCSHDIFNVTIGFIWE